ncbi:MAG: GTP-binding protein TypA [Candidatus Levybacteria bacterium RIFCSPHIGHO2_02_FULL_39_36]|nr:MAG: GTP-binding protein TypA [Candidatus Levybacteria bacterium GW2011_GWA1_39_11]KKR25223.1 MAG: GTP-binding protein TypA [Candidatus Levybacteria bacterium GW2011_GWB1_39_7]KKR27137.1 MAG: GTP-binding protein [Microgenomates group bacterium GW2011_GWC1_39_7]OGH15217.1 MAG: GTP-binding protein TypA [Candidatus Levybacteria bacterium RIFCSPHIGHO2_01_FULL_38_96]OGH25914.1 MAG: GTP-binding protein TypA [Candidatus Levybacteria bacterium RIFCSPHIGHO2_12_FULL_39_39]OGH28343.1 MAG: GTP-binding 
MDEIRNVAIIAHVDHGKTTLVDALLRQTKTKIDKHITHDLIMDSNELERERGITIFSKNASVTWNGIKINIIDTPGHADFGGEVERVLKMADGCLLLVDAKDGPMPQTRFVLKQALKMKHKVIVVVNKIDRTDARINHVINKTFDLFMELGADDGTADFPIIYASAKDGKASPSPDLSEMKDITPLLEEIVRFIPSPTGDKNLPLQMLITTLGNDAHRGRVAVGRIHNGEISANQEVVRIDRDGIQKKYKLTSLMTFEGLEKVSTDKALAGDIVAVSGIPDANIGETIADLDNPVALPLIDIEEPTIKMTFRVNDSPFAGREGEFKTSRQIQERLYKELENDIALRVENESSGGWTVSGRGELHLAILIERLRREGYEFQVERPQVIEKNVDGKVLTPYEQVFIEVPEDASGIVMQKMGMRHGELREMNIENGIAFMEFIIATKELFGYRSEFLVDTRGLGIINTIFYEYRPDKDVSYSRERGSLVAYEAGTTNTYGLVNTQDRGLIFIKPGDTVYKGQVIGRNSRSDDLRINVCRTKHLTNNRSKGEGVSVALRTPKEMDLEDALEYIDDTELVEITPKNIRIRKKVLDEAEDRRLRSQGLL